MTRGPPGPASGFSSTGGGGGMSSILGFAGSVDWATLGAGGIGAGALARSEARRQATMAPMASKSAAATMAYFALPPDAGTPAGGRLEGLVIRNSWGSRVRGAAGRV